MCKVLLVSFLLYFFVRLNSVVAWFLIFRKVYNCACHIDYIDRLVLQYFLTMDELELNGFVEYTRRF